MHQIHLNDQLYQEAQRRASAAGFVTVDEYVADVLRHDLQEETENFDYLFTPERLAHVDRAAAQIDAGQGIPAEQVRDHFRQNRNT
jgi:PHD/YefM family antitoxin component YafN of YafNO toxin-antitoxin module